ncbi:AcrR family transcriptional regulator [Streptacidiphilus sp. MAP12-16]|uniref:TetR/AcrR family transcriptional regulator n=1 Tax=Streptacidiphilus sp. MAP12-16 TaxID=3156300 RepID=UPI0035145BAF
MTSAARPPWPSPWDAEPRTPKRRTLSREAIVEVALGIVDAEGLEALSMRRIAQELNTGPASLYAHVSNKEQLVELLLDRAYRDLRHPFPDPEQWRTQAKEFLRQWRDNLVAHGDLARAAMQSNIPTTPHALDAAESMLALLRAGGLSDQVAAYGVDLLALYVVSSAYEQSTRTGPNAEPDQSQAYLDGIRGFFASLPGDRYPVLTSMVAALTRDSGDERFDFGLDVIIAGLLAREPG